MKLIDGKRVASVWAKGLQRKFKQAGKLVAILVGDNPASLVYLEKKALMAKELGVQFELCQFKANVNQSVVEKKIASFNVDKKVAGMIVQLPLPTKWNTAEVINTIIPSKDVDGLTDANISSGEILPATAVGILKLLEEYQVKLRGRNIVLVGFTRLLNIPLSIYLASLKNNVTVLQEGTRNKSVLCEADVIITATGKSKLITGKDVKNGAVIVDAGVSRVNKKLVGDVDFASVSKKARLITPVPGGVGPMTVVALFANLYRVAESRSGR